ncbi:biotin/lipoyl-containing protein [Candidatus Avelusimicrobium facis]|uniref:acetyl-CoA carboxylase biotin carboxyl carrier protein n=1 Tax=Candidatus Avelusimicrobium facis TaxID=3416203 RepID=UPI0015B7534B
MDTKLITEITQWLKTTDLAEFCYRKDHNCIEIKTSEALPEPAEFSCRLQVVAAPALGIYHRAAKGKNLPLKEGQKVVQGAGLGYIQTHGQKHEVTAPTAGTLRIISIEEGQPAEYGQPLFFIEP